MRILLLLGLLMCCVTLTANAGDIPPGHHFSWNFEKIQAETKEPYGYLVTRPDLALHLLRQLSFDYERDFDRAHYLRHQIEYWGHMRNSTPINNTDYESITGIYQRLNDELTELVETAIDKETARLNTK